MVRRCPQQQCVVHWPLPFSTLGAVVWFDMAHTASPSVHITSMGHPTVESNETYSFQKGGPKPLQVKKWDRTPEEEDCGEPEG